MVMIVNADFINERGRGIESCKGFPRNRQGGPNICARYTLYVSSEAQLRRWSRWLLGARYEKERNEEELNSAHKI